MAEKKGRSIIYENLARRKDSLNTKFNNFTLNPPTTSSMTVYQSGHKSNCEPGWHTRIRTYDHYIIHYVLDGKGTYYAPAGTYPVKKGDLFLIRPDESIHYQADWNTPWTYYWVGFNGGEAPNIVGLCGFSDTCLLRSYTLDDALAEIQNLKESVLMSGVAGNYTGLKMPAAEEGEPVTKNTSAAISLFSSYQNYTGLVYSDDASAMLLSEASAMLSEDKVGIPAVPKYKFISRQVEENFNNGAQALMPMIAAFTGEDISKITYAPEALANGSMLASPVYYAGGDMYRIRNETIQVNRDGQWAFAGFISTDDSQMRSQGQAFKQETALFVPEPEADVEKPETETPSRNVSSDTGFTGIVKDPFSQMLHADPSVFAGISTKEEAIRHRDEILEKYNSPMLKYEMDKLIKEIWGK